MKEHLKHYLDSVFAAAPVTRRNEELKEEILSNLYDKYDQYCAEGLSPEEAYRRTVSGIGDLSALFERIENAPAPEQAPPRAPLYDQTERERFSAMRAILLSGAIVLYVLSVLPSMLWSHPLAAVLLFVMVALGTGMILCQPLFADYTVPADLDEAGRERVRKSLRTATWMLAGAVAGYIVCVCPVILLAAVPALGIVGMLLLIALSTVTIVLRSLLFGKDLALLQREGEEADADSASRKKKEKKEKKEKGEREPRTAADKIYGVATGIFWGLAVVVYFLVSFVTGRWATSWLVFVCALLLYGIVSGVYHLVRRRGTAGPIVKIVICSVLLFSVMPVQLLTGDGGFPKLSLHLDVYDDEEYEVGEVELPAEGLEALSVHWVDGEVRIALWEEDTVAVREVYAGTDEAVEDEDEALRYRLEDGRLTVRQHLSPVGIFVNRAATPKELTVYLPATLALRELDVECVAADVYAEGLSDLSELRAVTVSGELAFENCRAAEWQMDSVSGNVILTDCYAEELGLDSVSGTLKATLLSPPVAVEMDSVSGALNLTLPADIEGFRANVDSLSGNSHSDFEDVSYSGKNLRYGNGHTTVDFDSVSGSLFIGQATE